jgi:hypothetical protein
MRTIQQQDGNTFGGQCVAALFDNERQQIAQLNASCERTAQLIEQTQASTICYFTGHAS